MEIDVLIDTLTDCLMCSEDGLLYDTEYRRVTQEITLEKALKLKKQGWKFMDKFDKFGEAMRDGRLTVASEGKVYRLREAIRYSEQLGRPLTSEELKQFEV